MLNYAEALKYLEGVSWLGIRPGLERIEELLRRLGSPERRCRYVHVAGTNGKGSTSAMLAAMLTAAGYRTGLYTSPHLLRLTERMRIDGAEISPEELAGAVAALARAAEGMAEPCTEFELITAAALWWFAERGCDKVSISEIVERADSSVGAFYGHFKSKDELVTRIWLDVTTSIIAEDTERAARITDKYEFVDFLVERAKESLRNPVMNSLYKYCRMTPEDARELSSYASRFLAMIRNMLNSCAPNASEETLWSYASLIHTIINARSREGYDQAYMRFSDSVLRDAILALMDACSASVG